MLQQGQVFALATRGRDGKRLWAYRYRTGGRASKRVQVGGFRSAEDARAALERALENLRREGGVGKRPTLADFVDEYLAQHEVSPVTLEKLRFLLGRAVQAFGDYYLDELDPVEISAWRMTVPPGYRFEATQALRQVLARAVVWGLLDLNPAKGREPAAAAQREAPVRVVGGARGARGAAWPLSGGDGALRRRDRHATGRVGGARAPRHRPPRPRRLRAPLVHQGQAHLAEDRGEHPRRAAPGPCAGGARAATAGRPGDLLFPAERGGYLDLHNFRNRKWKPAQLALAIEPFRRIYDLRHTFATFALRAGISTFELSRYMGASLTMIDRHYGHLARDGREHAIRLLDELNAPAVDAGGRPVDAEKRGRRPAGQRNRPLSRE
jgi:integrase